MRVSCKLQVHRLVSHRVSKVRLMSQKHGDAIGGCSLQNENAPSATDQRHVPVAVVASEDSVVAWWRT